MPMPDRMILQVNTARIKAKHEQYGACLTFKNRNKDLFPWDAEDNINELMGDNPQVTHPDITVKFPGMLMESDHDGSTAAVETPIVDYNSVAAVAADAGIQHCEDDPAGDQPPPPPYRGLLK